MSRNRRLLNLTEPSLTIGLVPLLFGWVSGDFNVGAAARDRNILELPGVGDSFGAVSADGRRRILAADDNRRDEERNLVHQTGVEEQACQDRTTFNQHALD